MKKLSLLAMPIATLGMGLLCTPTQSAFAASHTLNQTNLDAAIAAGGIETNGISCQAVVGIGGPSSLCAISGGDWTLASNINASDVVFFLTDDATITGSSDYTLTAYGIQTTNDKTYTFNNLNYSGGPIVGAADLNINGGNYSSADDFGLFGIAGGTTTITGGTFTVSSGASVIYIQQDAALNISGGTFTSPQDSAIEASINDEGSINISGGTFTGGMGGLMFFPSYYSGTVSLSGGTFSGGTGSIIIFGFSGAPIMDDLLASGYYYTNTNAIAGTIEGLTATYISGTTTVTNGSTTTEDGTGSLDNTTTNTTGGMGIADDEDSTAETVATTSSDDTASEEDSTESSSTTAPDTGAPTAEVNAKNTSISLLAALATAATTLFGFFKYKQYKSEQ